MSALRMISLLIFMGSSLYGFSQNNIGIGTPTPNTSALLDVSSTTKGMLAPRMTTTQRNAIAGPAKGLLVYDTDLNALYHFNGSTWATVGVGFTLPYSGGISNPSTALSITNTGAGGAIAGSASANSIAAIEGSSTATVGGNGVLGSSTSATGSGVGGINPNGNAVSGFSSGTGTALRGVSTAGYGLLVSGNLRLTGGNTNPSAGAVLTSVDANGNAVWKARKVAFNATHSFPFANVAASTATTLFLNLENFDAGNDFNTQDSPVDPSTFIAPVSGAYAFSASVEIFLSSSVFNLSMGEIYLQINGNRSYSVENYNPANTIGSSTAFVSLNTTVHLNAGDKVKIVIEQNNSGSMTAKQYNPSFSGHLVFED
jgi:hypothetical protein